MNQQGNVLPGMVTSYRCWVLHPTPLLPDQYHVTLLNILSNQANIRQVKRPVCCMSLHRLLVQSEFCLL